MAKLDLTRLGAVRVRGCTIFDPDGNELATAPNREMALELAELIVEGAYVAQRRRVDLLLGKYSDSRE